MSTSFTESRFWTPRKYGPSKCCIANSADENLLSLQVPLGVRACAGLIRKGEIGSSPDDIGTFKVQVGVHDAFMRLDAAALRALNLFTTSRDAAAVPTLNESTSANAVATDAGGTSSAGNRITSLHGLVSYGCKTKGGRRLLRQWILQPLVDLAKIHARQDLVSAFVMCSPLRKSWKEGTNVPDLEALAARLNRKNASLLDLLRLYQFSLLLPTLVRKLEEFDGDASVRATLHDKFISKLNWAAEELRKYMEMCEQVIRASLDPHVCSTTSERRCRRSSKMCPPRSQE
jgi:DNA mismatch repair protein MSH2